MRPLPLLALPSLLCLACPGPSEICGLPTTLPTDADVADGRGAAIRSDGVAFDEEGSWSAATLSITMGTLDIIATNDETGSSVGELIEAAAFPICVPIRDRSETSGSANLLGDGFVSDADHTGGVAILGREGDTLLGRFAFELGNPAGDSLTFSDGAFRLPTR
jgi:hypothetical protein